MKKLKLILFGFFLLIMTSSALASDVIVKNGELNVTSVQFSGDLIGNGSLLENVPYRNLTDSDVTNLGFTKDTTSNLSQSDVLSYTKDYYYNYTEQIHGNNITELVYRNLTDSDITTLGYFKVYRNLTDTDLRNLGYLKTGNTSEEILLETRDTYTNLTGDNFSGDIRTDGKLDVGTTTQFNSNAWITGLDTGLWFDTFLSYTYGLFRDVAGNLLLRFDTTEHINMTTDGDILISSDVNITKTVRAEKFIGDASELSEVPYKNLTDSDITGLGFTKDTASNLSQSDVLGYTRDYYHNYTEKIHGNNITELVYRNLTESDVTGLGFTKDTASNLTQSNVLEYTRDTFLNSSGDTATGNLTFSGSVNNVGLVWLWNSITSIVEVGGNYLNFYGDYTNNWSRVILGRAENKIWLGDAKAKTVVQVRENITVDGYATIGKNLTVTQDVTAANFIGDGSQLTEIPYTNITSEDITNFGYKKLDQDLNTTDDVLFNEGNFTANITAEGEHTVLHAGVMQNFTCALNQAAPGAGWESDEWDTGNCQGYDPDDYTYCMYNAWRVDGAASERGLYIIYKDAGWIFASIAGQVILQVNFWCWN